MNCPSCSAALENSARFCGVCGYRLQAPRAPTPAPFAASAPAAAAAAAAPAAARAPVGTPASGSAQPVAQARAQAPAPAVQRPKTRSQLDDLFLNSVLNNRFKI